MITNFDKWNWNSYNAMMRQGVSFVSGGVTLGVAWHFLGPDQATSITTDVNHVVNGFTEMLQGIAGLVGTGTVIYNGWRAAHNASPVEQAKSLEAAVPGTVIVTAPEVAKAVPSNNVVANTEVKVLPK